MSYLARRITAAVENAGGLTNLSSPGSWLLEAMGGGKTASGVRVTPESALSDPTILRCVMLLSGLRAFLPLKVYRARKDGGADIDRSHPNYMRLAYQPNQWMTSYEWRQYSALQELIFGTSYSLLFWRQDGTLESINPVKTSSVVCYVTEDGTPVYQVTLYPSSRVIWVSRYEMLRSWIASENGYTGISPIDKCKEAIGLGFAAREYNARMMSNGGVVSGILSIPTTLSAEAKAAAKVSWQEAHTGLGNLHKTAVLPSDVKFEPINTFKSTDLETIELRKLAVEEKCQIYGVPPELAQHTSAVTSWGTGVAERFRAFLATTLDLHLTAHEQAMQRDLFTPDELDVVWPQYNRGALLRTDLLTRYQSYAIGRQWGWLTVNKILVREDENPIGPEGDVLLDPVNMVRIPLDPTAELGNGNGTKANADLDPRFVEFIRKALGPEGSRHA